MISDYELPRIGPTKRLTWIVPSTMTVLTMLFLGCASPGAGGSESKNTGSEVCDGTTYCGYGRICKYGTCVCDDSAPRGTCCGDMFQEYPCVADCPSDATTCNVNGYTCRRADGKCSHGDDCIPFSALSESVGVTSCGEDGYCHIGPDVIDEIGDAINRPGDVNAPQDWVVVKAEVAYFFANKSSIGFTWDPQPFEVVIVATTQLPSAYVDLAAAVWSALCPANSRGVTWSDGIEQTANSVAFTDGILYFTFAAYDVTKLVKLSRPVPVMVGRDWPVVGSSCNSSGSSADECWRPDRPQMCLDKKCRRLCMSHIDCGELNQFCGGPFPCSQRFCGVDPPPLPTYETGGATGTGGTLAASTYGGVVGESGGAAVGGNSTGGTGPRGLGGVSAGGAATLVGGGRTATASGVDAGSGDRCGGEVGAYWTQCVGGGGTGAHTGSSGSTNPYVGGANSVGGSTSIGGTSGAAGVYSTSGGTTTTGGLSGSDGGEPGPIANGDFSNGFSGWVFEGSCVGETAVANDDAMHGSALGLYLSGGTSCSETKVWQVAAVDISKHSSIRVRADVKMMKYDTYSGPVNLRVFAGTAPMYDQDLIANHVFRPGAFAEDNSPGGTSTSPIGTWVSFTSDDLTDLIPPGTNALRIEFWIEGQGIYGWARIDNVTLVIDDSSIPVTSIAASPSNGTTPLLVSFAGMCTNASDSCTRGWWDFGDGPIDIDQVGGGSTATGLNSLFQFDSRGTYNVSFTSEDSKGAARTAVYSIVAANNPPAASIQAQPSTGAAPLSVQFTALASDTDGSVANYAWSFGDGQTSNDPNPIHVFQNVGTYLASLRVVDNLGAATTTYYTIVVQ